MNLSEALDGRQAYRMLEHGFDAAFDAANPLRHLGALAMLFLAIVIVSGAYLYIRIDTSVLGVYRSIEDVSRERLGGLLHSLHRYAADAFLLLTLLHLGRELLLGRYANFRRFSWLTGLPLLGFAFVAGVVGFWLKWDRLAQFTAVATAEWLDALSLFAIPLTRNFLVAAAVSDRLFSLFIFVHIGLPLMLVFGLWFHLQRLSRAEVLPPASLGLGSCATLLALAVVLPVGSEAAADMSVVPRTLALDWFYLWPQVLLYASSAETLWALLAFAVVALCLLPFLPGERLPAAARVDPENCNGCRRCVEDCPYAAVTMVPHPNGRTSLAQVDSDLCARCGICAGSCPSATPFRGSGDLVTGIDMPEAPLAVLRLAVDRQLARVGPRGILVFGCRQGAATEALSGDEVAAFDLICAGMLPPSFVEYALRGGAAGVLVASCRPGACAYRLGERWTEERLAGLREPQLRASVESRRLRLVQVDRGEQRRLAAALADFRRTLSDPPGARGEGDSGRVASHV